MGKIDETIAKMNVETAMKRAKEEMAKEKITKREQAKRAAQIMAEEAKAEEALVEEVDRFCKNVVELVRKLAEMTAQNVELELRVRSLEEQLKK